MDKRAKILIVDDEPFNIDYLEQELQDLGCETVSAQDGQEALEQVTVETPDLILLDIRMPGMDGYQVCQCLKADEQTHDIPIIFLSALGETEDKVRAFAVGGVDYITKPFQFEEVMARVETHLTLRDLQKQLQQANKELARQLEELACSNAELQARNEELDAYDHTVAHDLKNPLALVIGYADILELKGVTMPDQELQEHLRAIAQHGRKMCDIIDELLLLSGLRNIEEIDTVPLDMTSIVIEVQRRLAYMTEQHRAEIILPESWPVALGYGPWVEEVWSNYLSNAIKYGGRPPRVELGAVEQPDGSVRFWVRDNGLGLTPEEQTRLFTRFTRLDQDRAKGHGLGLSIVQRIMDRLGGKVGVESQTGQGCVFYFVLPSAG